MGRWSSQPSYGLLRLGEPRCEWFLNWLERELSHYRLTKYFFFLQCTNRCIPDCIEQDELHYFVYACVFCT